MNLTALEIEGFGIWSGLQVQRFSESLNVVYGPNEAGKTTLLQFIRSMLYGFSPERRRYLPPVHGGRPGGSLELTGPHGRFRVARYADSDDGAELCTLTAPDGARQGEHFMKVLLANVDEAVFNNVFAVGLREMQELAALGDTEAAAMLYNLTAGLDRVSLVDVLGELNLSRNRLLDAEGGPCRLSQLLVEREKLRGEIEELESVNRRYGQLAAERDRLHEEVVRLEEESARLDHSARIVDLALALREAWNPRAALEAELAALGPMKNLPERALQRLDALNARLEKIHRSRRRLMESHEAAKREYAGLAVSEPLARHAARIEALKDQEPWIVQLRDRIDELRAEIGRIESERAAERERLGLAAIDDALPALSAKTLAALRPSAKSLRRNRRLLAAARQEAETARLQARSVQEQVDAELKSRGCGDLSAAMDQAVAAVAQLRRRAGIDNRLDQLTRCRGELEERSRGLVERQMLPAWALAGFGALFVLGAALLLSSLFFSETMVGAAGTLTAVLGLGGLVASVGGKMMLDRSNLRQYDACQKQLSVLQTQIQQVKEERESLDAQLPRGAGTIQVRLQAAERELAAMEALAPLEARRDAARQEAASAERRVAEAARAFRAARRRWRESLSAFGLSPNIRPRQVRRLVPFGARMAERNQLLARRREELEGRQREWEAAANRIAQLAADAGVALKSADPLEQLRHLADAAARQQAAAARRETLRREARRRRAALARRDEAAARVKHLRRRLFLEVGAADERDFRRLAVESARAEVLRRQRDAISRDIEAALKSHCSEEAIRRQIEGEHAASLDIRRKELQMQAAAVEKQLHETLERRGRLAAQLDALAADRTIASKHLDAAVLDKRIEETIRRWQSLAAACAILDAIRAAYERQRQPEALREASGYLERLTQGRYGRVWTPLGEQTLRVDDAEGRSLPVEALSRGTREQLFLSLRLALASSYARRGADLPLVLDDVLVNFDAERARAAAAVLRDYAAAGHQLLVFTCHEHILQLFQAIDAPVGRLPSHAAPGRVVIAVEPRVEAKVISDPEPRPARRKASARSKRSAAPVPSETEMKETPGREPRGASESDDEDESPWNDYGGAAAA